MPQKIDYDFNGLKSKCITRVETQLGYMQMLEYILQDKSFLHVIEWSLSNDKEEKSDFPKYHCKTFYKQKYEAGKFAHEIGNNLLQQYII